MTSFKVFASCVAIVCLASVARAYPVQKPVSATSENPIIEKHGCTVHCKNVGQNVVDHKTYDSMLITNEVVQKPAVHEPMVSQELHRQRRTFDAEEEQRLRKELESSSSVDSKPNGPLKPDPSNEDSKQSNEDQNSEQSNEVQSSEQSNEAQSSEQSNEAQSSEQSNEVQSSEQSNEDPDSEQPDELTESEQANDDENNENNETLPRELPEPESSYESEEAEVSHESGEAEVSHESGEAEVSHESGENPDKSASTGDDKEDKSASTGDDKEDKKESDKNNPPAFRRASF